MKKLLLLSTCTILSSGNEIDIENIYESGQFQKCYDISNEQMKNDFTDEKANLYFGMCAYSLGKYKESVETLERVLIINEENQRGRLELAKSYMALKMYEVAKNELLIVLQTHPPQNVKINVEKFIDYIDKQSKQNSYSLVASLSSGYDTNTNASQSAEALQSIYPNSTSIGEVDAYYLNETLNFSHFYRPRNNEHFLLQNNLLFANQNNFDNNSKTNENEYNYSYVKVTTSPSYLSQDFKISPNFFVSRLTYGNKSLLNTVGLNPEFSYIVNKNLKVDLSTQYYQKNYFNQSDYGKELEHYDGAISINYFNGNDMLFGKITVANENKKYDSLENFIDKNSVNINGGYNFSNNKYTGGFGISYLKSSYDDNALLSLSKREDTTRSYFGTLNYRVNENLDFGIMISKQINDSNEISAEYSKLTTGLVLTYKTRGLF